MITRRMSLLKFITVFLNTDRERLQLYITSNLLILLFIQARYDKKIQQQRFICRVNIINIT